MLKSVQHRLETPILRIRGTAHERDVARRRARSEVQLPHGIGMAEIAGAIGMRVVAFDPHAEAAEMAQMGRSFDAVLAEADFVVCLVAATPETQNLMDARAFATMKRGAWFINLARGELVDEDALEAALDAGHLGGAGLDVGRAPDQMPSPRFRLRPDVVATPHVGGATQRAREHQAMDVIRQLQALAEGRMPEGAVNSVAAYRLERFRTSSAQQCPLELGSGHVFRSTF